ncbi:hypothetical protein MNBD_GAMMA09-2390 [hydrothermal vent metagenome]|uniref:Uncharacterized protein n=1 Tax=hydrothermal vent metagenome TaxID=652676 RepID=A0A3B0XY31_9ZZZZ
MKKKISSFLSVVLLFSSLVFISNSVQAVVDNDASIVKLYKVCTVNNVEIPNCFTTSASLMSWIGNTRTVSTALTVEAGPGVHDFFRCSDTDKLSIVGAGPTQTSFQGLHASNCFDLNVQNITITNSFPAPIYWIGDGSSIWTNVQVLGDIYAWTETNCGLITKRPVHKWFSSQLWSKSKTVFLASCSENWIFGSELVLKGPSFNGVKNGIMVRAATGENTYPEVHLYGGNLRVILQDDEVYSGMNAVKAGRNGEVHIHGTGIDVIGNNLNNNVTAINAVDGGIVHAAQSAFVMKTTGNGKLIRISNIASKVMAPYLWESDILAKGSDFVSVNGADSTTETVCNNAVCIPHSLIYTDSCTANGPWYDISSNSCR